MVHLMLVASDIVCADHAGAGGHGEHLDQAISSPVGHEAYASTNTDGGVGDEPCRIPTRARCCEALASCNMSIAVSASSGGIDPRGIRRAVPSDRSRFTQPQPAGPEPPPPRA